MTLFPEEHEIVGFCKEDTVCFLWDRNSIIKYYVENRPMLVIF
jgi:hypothetical protein